MVRKLGMAVLVALAITVPIGLITTLSSGASAASSGASAAPQLPVTFTGNISCSLTGVLTFSPPLTNTNQTYTVTFKGKNNHCQGLDGTKLKQHGETLKSSKDKYTFTTGTGCSGLSGGATPPIPSEKIKWIGSSPITSSTVSFPAGTFNTSTLTFVYLGGTVTAGSFNDGNTGTAQVALQITGQTLASLAAACAGAGIASLNLIQPNPEPPPFGPNDNLELGSLF